MSQQPLVSTVVLNWNRADLLRRTLESYREATTVPHELFIVDNASTDGSREVIEAFCRDHPQAQAIYMDENRGGEAFNEGLARARGRLLHLSENDLEYRPGWAGEALELFERFPRLGQLSLFGPVPEDEEVWEPKPCRLIRAGSRFVYEAAGNVGTSSLLRRELWEAGVRVHNIEGPGGVRLPNDPRLSEEVRRAGYLVAWAPRYLVRNLGHEAEEFRRREDYYRANYAAKPWLGEEGWRRRLEAWERSPRPRRASRLFPGEPVSAELGAAASRCREPRLWSMFDTWSPEVETVEFLHALARLLKPERVVEVGAWRGLGSEALARALHENGRGRLLVVEPREDLRREVAGRLEAAGLAGIAELPAVTDFGQLEGVRAGVVVWNRDVALEAAGLAWVAGVLEPGGVAVLQGVADEPGRAARVERWASQWGLRRMVFPTPRGLVLVQRPGVEG